MEMEQATIGPGIIHAYWVHNAFDRGDVVYQNGIAIGFIHNCIVSAEYMNDVNDGIKWSIQASMMSNDDNITWAMRILIKRLALAYDAIDSHVESYLDVRGNVVIQQFFYKPD